MSQPVALSEDPSRGRLVRCIGMGGAARIVAALAETPVEELRRRHGLVGPALTLGAEALLANVLLSAHIKGEERILMEARASAEGVQGPITYSGEVSADGRVRARFVPGLLPPVRQLDGTLIAIKWDRDKEVYRGAAPLEHVGFQEALQGFLERSQQTEGLVRLGCELGPDGELAVAAGVLVERLPGEAPLDLTPLAALPLGELVAGLRGELDGPMATVGGDPVAVLEVSPLTYSCTCSLARVESTLRALGAEELRDLLATQGEAEVTCHFCQSRYHLGPEELEALIASLG